MTNKPISEWIEWDPHASTGFPEVPEGMRIAWYRLQNGYEQMCRNPRMLDWGPRSPRDTQIVAYKLEPATFVATAALAQQPAAVDGAKEADLWRCTVCGRVGTVGRCCGEETREPFHPLR